MDDLKNASQLINSLLLTRGYQTSELQFPSLTAIQDDASNDKLVINTIYSLLQQIDKADEDMSYLKDQLQDKTEIIKHFEKSNEELNSGNHKLNNTVKVQENEISLLKYDLKQGKLLVKQRDVTIQKEKQTVVSIQQKFQTEIKKKDHQIDQLQSKLLMKRTKYFNIMKNHAYNSSSGVLQTSNSMVLDQELETMMTNLSELIDSLILQRDDTVTFIQGFINSLRELHDTSKPTELSNDITELKSILMQELERLKESSTVQPQTNDSRVKELELTISKLQANLDSVMETNEQWRKKFDKR